MRKKIWRYKGLLARQADQKDNCKNFNRKFKMNKIIFNQKCKKKKKALSLKRNNQKQKLVNYVLKMKNYIQ